MKYDEKNVIVKNVLSQNEIEQIYDALKNPSNHYIMKRFNQSISDFTLPETVAEKIIKHCEEISGESNLKITEYQFSRYKKIINDDGSIGNPNLTPHYDETFLQPRFTFDYQMKSNTNWPIIVEEKDFILSDNEALTFSGTHQIHWRSKKIFKDDEFIDMLFFHLTKNGADNVGLDVNNVMNNKAKKYRDIYDSIGENNG